MGIYNDPLDNLTPEQVQQLFDRAIKNEATENRSAAEREAALTFCSAHPEYVRCQENMRAMTLAIHYSGTQINSADDWQKLERIYDDLCQRGMLRLDEQVVAQQQEDARQQRINRSRGLSYTRTAEELHQETEDDAYSMSMEDLERLANEELVQEQARESTIAGLDTETSNDYFRRRIVRRSGI